MSAFGVKLPITFDTGDGFTMVKTIKQTVRQNLKMLLLTNPGERVMIPDYGVGIKRFLFENFHNDTVSGIEERLQKQVKTYLPIVTIEQFNTAQAESTPNGIAVQIVYRIPDLGIRDLLEFTI